MGTANRVQVMMNVRSLQGDLEKHSYLMSLQVLPWYCPGSVGGGMHGRWRGLCGASRGASRAHAGLAGTFSDPSQPGL